ncbi:MAG: endonuclease/exonuclease/phosphatase family protein [Sideroxydans sp.]|nr:endonuclease/exonuclease/phosphatase family protein [Sideroxydans sp.]
MPSLKIASYNIHKGFSPFNRRVVLHELREFLRALDADIVFLQEVQGSHLHHAKRHPNYPEVPQYEFLADDFWAHHAYGMNAVYEAGHHGNAILSRFPIVQTRNKDVSAHRFEQRGLLHCEVEWQGTSVHCFCAHFGLFAKGRRAQANALVAHVKTEVAAHESLIIAGDFNDWGDRLSNTFADELGVHDAFHLSTGAVARSFPAKFPLLKLDRIYARGFDASECDVHGGTRMSDHAALTARLRRQ